MKNLSKKYNSIESFKFILSFFKKVGYNALRENNTYLRILRFSRKSTKKIKETEIKETDKEEVKDERKIRKSAVE